MKKLLSTLTLLVLTAAVAAAQPSTPPSKPEQKAEEKQKPEEKKDTKAAPSPAGKWNVNVETQQGAMPSTLELKLDGKKITGTIASQMGESALEGEFADGKLKFWFTLQANGNNVPITFNGAFKDDGSLAGTLEYGQGPISWTATRVKG